MKHRLDLPSSHLGAFVPLMSLILLTAAPTRLPGAQATPGENGVWTLENNSIRVAVHTVTGHLAVRDKRAGLDWEQIAPAQASSSPRFQNLRAVPGGLVFDTTFSGGGTNRFSVKLTLEGDAPDLHVDVEADHALKIDRVWTLPPLVLDTPSAALAVADYCNGHLYPLAPKPQRTWFSLWQIDMPWAGLCDVDRGRACAVMVETADDAILEMSKVNQRGRELYGLAVGFSGSHGTFREPRKFFYHFAAQGGYVALAKRYRELARQQGLIVTLEEKLKKNPNLARLFGAPDVWGDGSVRFARAAKAAGVEKMLIHGRASSNDMAAINDLGYLTSNYDIYADMMQAEPGREEDSHHGQVPADVVQQASGERMKAWLTWDKKQYMKRCPQVALRTARVVIPKDLGQRPFIGRFIDVATAEELYECYDPAHPMTRGGKRQASAEMLGYVRSLGLVVGGEHGRCWAVPQLDYIEGMQSGGSYSWPAGWLLRPKSKDQEFDNPHGGKFGKWEAYAEWGIGHRYRVPLWELVFHDCVVSTWYWGDSSDFLLQAAPEITPKKDAFNLLYGTMPMLWANKEGAWTNAREVFLRTYRNTCKLHEAVAGKEMLTHEFLTSDRAAQRTTFSDGTEAIVNFGDAPYEARLGGRTLRLPKNGWVVKGPRLEQSLALVDGKAVTTIRAGSYQFTETAP
jgi:hypothetical protein